MIRDFRHKGLKRFFESGDARGISSEHRKRIYAILSVLEAGGSLDDLSLPTYHLHELSGVRKGTWSVTVRANWRITFRFAGDDVSDVDLEDYH